MKKILTGILALLLGSFTFSAFAQTNSTKCKDGQVWDEAQGKCVLQNIAHICKFPKVWDEEQGKCVIIDKEHSCLGYEVWSEGLGRCVSPKKCVVPTVWNDYQGRCVAPTKCNAPQVWSSEQGQCITPEEPEYDELVNVPSLEHFTLEEGDITDDDIYLVFAPKGNLDFRLHVYLYNEAGRDTLATWCSGDEKLCKAVGNGKTCSGARQGEGTDAWCYEGGVEVAQEAKAIQKAEKVEMVEKIKKVN